jgi:hypothetical protein
MERRALLGKLPALLFSLLMLNQDAENFAPDEHQSGIVMKHFAAHDVPPGTMTVYLDGIEVSALTTSTYAPLSPSVEAGGWCELLVLNDNGMPFTLESGGDPVTEIKEGQVRWEMMLETWPK